MVLSSDVTDRGGRTILLKAGSELTEKHLKIFKTWGVVQVDVKGKDNSTPLNNIINAHPELEISARLAVKSTFKHTNLKHPFFKELSDLWVQNHIKQRAAEI